MKKTMVILAAAIIGLSSCGGGLKKDVEATVKLRCEKNELREKIEKGDSTASARLDKVSKELEELEEKLRDKYESKRKDKDFGEKVMKYQKDAREKYCPEK